MSTPHPLQARSRLHAYGDLRRTDELADLVMEDQRSPVMHSIRRKAVQTMLPSFDNLLDAGGALFHRLRTSTPHRPSPGAVA